MAFDDVHAGAVERGAELVQVATPLFFAFGVFASGVRSRPVLEANDRGAHLFVVDHELHGVLVPVRADEAQPVRVAGHGGEALVDRVPQAGQSVRHRGPDVAVLEFAADTFGGLRGPRLQIGIQPPLRRHHRLQLGPHHGQIRIDRAGGDRLQQPRRRNRLGATRAGPGVGSLDPQPQLVEQRVVIDVRPRHGDLRGGREHVRAVLG